MTLKIHPRTQEFKHSRFPDFQDFKNSSIPYTYREFKNPSIFSNFCIKVLFLYVILIWRYSNRFGHSNWAHRPRVTIEILDDSGPIINKSYYLYFTVVFPERTVRGLVKQLTALEEPTVESSWPQWPDPRASKKTQTRNLTKSCSFMAFLSAVGTVLASAKNDRIV